MDRLVLSDTAWARMVPLFTGDPEKLAGPERERLGLHRLPATLEKAPAALEGDPCRHETCGNCRDQRARSGRTLASLRRDLLMPAMSEGDLLIAQTAYAERAPKEC